MDMPYGMDAAQHGWNSRNSIRLRNEMVRRFYAIATRTVYGRHRPIECLSPLTLASHIADGHRLRGLDRHRRRGDRRSRRRGAGRIRRAVADALHRAHSGRRYRTKACIERLTMMPVEPRPMKALACPGRMRMSCPVPERHNL